MFRHVSQSGQTLGNISEKHRETSNVSEVGRKHFSFPGSKFCFRNNVSTSGQTWKHSRKHRESQMLPQQMPTMFSSFPRALDSKQEQLRRIQPCISPAHTRMSCMNSTPPLLNAITKKSLKDLISLDLVQLECQIWWIIQVSIYIEDIRRLRQEIWILCSSGKNYISRVSAANERDIREAKIPRYTGTGDIHVPVLVNRVTTCNLRNPRYSSVLKPIREWQLSLLRFAIDC
jgi:hypothetical protein